MKPTTRLTADLLASDTAHLLHPFTDFAQYKKAPGRTYVRGEGVHIIDSEGRELLDGMSGLWCTNLGYSQQTIIDAITQQLNALPFYNSFFNCSTDATIELAERMTDLLPEGFNHVFLHQFRIGSQRHEYSPGASVFRPPGAARQENLY